MDQPARPRQPDRRRAGLRRLRLARDSASSTRCSTSGLFRDRSLAAGSLNLFLVFAVMFGIFLVLIQFLQAVLGFSALKASAGLLPMAAMMMPLSSIAPTIAKKFGTDSGADHRDR